MKLYGTMQCIQEKALAHDSACWEYARKFCEREELTTVPIWPLTSMIQSGCTLAQERCESQDRVTCDTTEGLDWLKARLEVVKCMPSIGYDIVF